MQTRKFFEGKAAFAAKIACAMMAAVMAASCSGSVAGEEEYWQDTAGDAIIQTMPYMLGEESLQELNLVEMSSKKLSAGTTIQITADQAFTYSAKTKTNIPNSSYYPLPRGAIDTISGNRISYKKNGTTYYYYKLKSGVRVSADDIKATSVAAPSGNKIRDIDLTYDDRYTYITLEMDQQVTYVVKYASTGISFNFKNTTSVPDSVKFSSNPLFSRAKWDEKTLTLQFNKKNAYMGYKAYYNKNGNLVIRFLNIPDSIENARVLIDAGHGGKDVGAVGGDGTYEKDLNASMAKYLAAELKSRGAQVKILDGDGYKPVQRREMAEEYGPDFFISIHCNSSTNTKATGTEVYYFYGADSKFASITSKNVSKSLNTDSRGAKKGIYHVILSPQMPSLLVETGFVSNASELKKLKKKSYQKKIASGIADSIEDIIEYMN